MWSTSCHESQSYWIDDSERKSKMIINTDISNTLHYVIGRRRMNISPRQSVSCLRHENLYWGEYHWTLVTNGEGPPLLVNSNGVLVPGGSIGEDLRIYLTTATRVYEYPPDVHRVNVLIVTKTFSPFATIRCPLQVGRRTRIYFLPAPPSPNILQAHEA